ncbi:MAG: glycosyltransferase family 2 protein [Candidatus Paceibacteria bacterium]
MDKGSIKNKDLVSAIIPTYNCAPWIQEAIESILNQTYKNIEIIIIDDGSTDNTKEVLEPYIKKNKIKYFYQENQGSAKARNKGVKKAQGEYIAFLDADDIWLPKKTEKQIKSIKKHPKIKLVISNSYLTNEEGRVINKYTNFIPEDTKDIIKDFFLRKIGKNTPTIFAERKAVLSIGGFDGSLPQREDHFFLMKMSQKYKIKHLKEPLVKIRDRENSTGQLPLGDPSKILDEFMPFINKSIKEFSFLKKYRDKEEAKLYHSIANRYYNHKKRVKTMQYSIKSIKKSFPGVPKKLIFILLASFLPVPIFISKKIKNYIEDLELFK